MRVVLAMAVVAALAACESPYQQALESPVLTRPQAPRIMADQRALDPYEKAPYFKRAN